MRAKAWLWLGVLGSSSFTAAASAQAPTVVAPAGPGQPALAVGTGPNGVIARTCAAAAGCTPAGGAAFEAPADVAARLGGARIRAVKIAAGRHLVRVDVETGTPGGDWVLLLAAPVAGGKGAEKPAEPRKLWSGMTGSSKGELGEGRVNVVLQDKYEGGERVIVGERWENVTICGRPTVVSARRVEPSTMTLERGAAVDNLEPLERQKAARVFATRAPAEPPRGLPLLRATAASSAVDKNFAALTDGDPETVWSENRVAEGRGEFVTMSSATEVPITAFDLRIRPKADVPDGAAPRKLLLATDDRLFEVTLPEDAWGQSEARYEVKLPAEVRTGCVALVLDEAYTRGAKAPRVSVAELSARTSFDGASLPSMVGALAGGGERARAAAALLARGGPPAVKATIEGYSKLDDAGRHLAGGVIDAAPCETHLPFFADLLVSLSQKQRGGAKQPMSFVDTRSLAEAELAHARDRIRRCGRAAAPVLSKIVTEGPDRARVAAADELALVAPAESVPVLLAAMARSDDGARRELRTALSHAAKSQRAWPAMAAELEPARWSARSEVVRIDLLRAMGAYIGHVQGSARVFAEIARDKTDFRSRYLLLAPAAELAREGDRGALAYVGLALRADPDAHVRARAAEVAGRVPVLLPHLAVAAEDADVRVRDAAAVSIARTATDADRPRGSPAEEAAARTALVRRLRIDPWTFVRANAARSLGALPADRSADEMLAAAVRDAAPDVRAATLDALGAHRASAHAPVIRQVADNGKEVPEVRARAILALAEMCDRASIDGWTKLARRTLSAADEADRRVGAAAIAALGRVHPADLGERLAPLLARGAPHGPREMARAAMAERGGCR